MNRLGLRTLALTGVSRSIAAFGGLAFTAMVGRMFGADTLGLFVFTNAIVLLLVMLTKFGGDRDLLKFIAIHRENVWSSDRMARLGSACLLSTGLAVMAALALAFMPTLLGYPPSPRLDTLAMLAPAIPFMTWMALNAGFLKGLSYPHLGTLFENGGVFALSALMLMLAGAANRTADLQTLIVLYIGAGIMAWVISLGLVFFLNRRSVDPGEVKEKKHKANAQARSNIQFTMIDITNFLISSGSFIIGALVLTDRDLGLLRGAERITLLIAFVINVTNIIVAPRIARSFADGSQTALVNAGRWAVRWNAYLATPIFLFCVIWPDPLIDLLGPDFAGIGPLIRIMAFGQLVNVLSGPCAMYLSMTEHATLTVKINLIALVISVILYITLSSLFGMTGFAIAYAASIILRNAMMLAAVRSRLQIWYLPRL